MSSKASYPSMEKFDILRRIFAGAKWVRCYKCGYRWLYKGKSKYYLTCPRCYTKLSLKKLSK